MKAKCGVFRVNNWSISAQLAFAVILLNGCASVTIDEHQSAATDLQAGQSIVVLGRRHSPNYETEPDLISCVGESIGSGDSGIRVIDEQEFVDQLYPWFEPRMAPLSPKRLRYLLKNPQVQSTLQRLNLKYMVWIDGKTETSNSSGSMACSPGAGCFGFGKWDDKSDYEASVWDYQDPKLVANVSADAQGTSYMPAIVLPIPMLARVQANACKGLGAQLRNMFVGNPNPS